MVLTRMHAISVHHPGPVANIPATAATPSSTTASSPSFPPPHNLRWHRSPYPSGERTRSRRRYGWQGGLRGTGASAGPGPGARARTRNSAAGPDARPPARLHAPRGVAYLFHKRGQLRPPRPREDEEAAREAMSRPGTPQNTYIRIRPCALTRSSLSRAPRWVVAVYTYCVLCFTVAYDCFIR